jgi:hypothetical protein
MCPTFLDLPMYIDTAFKRRTQVYEDMSFTFANGFDGKGSLSL